jgi:hypothetical protein
MSITTMTGAITGTAQTGFTSPTYTLTADNAQDVRSKQSYVSAVGGTQVGVTSHSVSAPFTVTVRRPSILKTIASAALNGITGQYSRVPYNEYVVLTRKAAQVASNQWFVNEKRSTIRIAAGSETYDAANVKALLSCSIGFENTNSAGLGDTTAQGTI